MKKDLYLLVTTELKTPIKTPKPSSQARLAYLTKPPCDLAFRKMAVSFDELLEFLIDQVAIRGESGESCRQFVAITSENVQKVKEPQEESNVMLFVYFLSIRCEATSDTSF